MSFSKRQGNDVVCYTKPLDSLKSWNDRFFWVDAFACPASFPWNSSKSVSKDPFPKSSQYNAEHYATLVAYPAPFHKYPEPFLCLIGISRNYTLDEDTYPQFLRDNDEEMDLLSFIRTADPTKVKVGERQRTEGKPKLLDTTMGHVVPLLPIAPAHALSELEVRLDKLFDKGGSGGQTEQGDSASGGHGVGILLVSETVEIVTEDAAPVQPKRQRKRKTIVSNAGEPSHPPKKLKEDYEASIGPSVAERESEDQTDSMAGANLRTVTALPRFVISSYSSQHSGANIAETEVDSFARPSIPLMTLANTITSTVDPATTVKEKFVVSSIFGGDSSGGGAATLPNVDLQKVYVPQWTITNGSRLDDGRTCREMVDEFAPPKFFVLICGMDHDQLFTEFSVGAARQMSLSDEVRMRAEYNIRERMRLNSVMEEKSSLLKAKDAEIEGLKAQLLVKEAEAAEAIRLCAEASNFEAIKKSLQVANLAASVKVREQEAADFDAMVTSVKSQNDNLIDQVHRLETSFVGLQDKVAVYENFIDQLEKFQDEKMAEVSEKFDKLCADFVEMALHLEEKFYPHLLTIISGRRWLLTHDMELTIAKCLNYTEYLSVLGSAIGKAVEKDASVDTIINLLRLEDTLAKRLGLTESQPNVNHLMVPIHHSLNQRVIGATALSLSLDVSNSRVRKIRENISNYRSALRGVFVPLFDPLSAAALEGMEGTPGAAPDTTTALSVTFISSSAIPPISTDDYEVAHADGQEILGADGQAIVDENVNLFPNIDGA
ncbi:hypothetical protein Tco_0953769 [Tanacetum coccineum]|uniref:Transposase (Putative), gypsy type n=1 Tax=Tanacetum coccineum TaxID=301880 RepID=A0ABQ5E4A0_9ASTR